MNDSQFVRICLVGWPGLNAEQERYMDVSALITSISTSQGVRFAPDGTRARDGTPRWTAAPAGHGAA